MRSDAVTIVAMHESLIARAADIACAHATSGVDLSGTTFVFGGRRPGLFLRRELARRLGRVFVPPAALSMDEFIVRCARGRVPESSLPHLDELYLLYRLIREIDAGVLTGRERFPAFAPWAQEVYSFIEQLDLEDVPSASLHAVRLQAEIGFDVPESVNRLLRCMAEVRERFHRALLERHAATRGMRYRAAAQEPLADLPFERLVFVAPFHLHTTERAVIAGLVRDDRAQLVIQGGADQWPVLRPLLKSLGLSEVAPLPEPAVRPRIVLHEAADVHTQAEIVRELMQSVPHDERTVVVLPDPGSLMPVLAEVAGAVPRYNVSLGFPLRRCPVYAMLDLILRAQESRSGNAYHAAAYLEALRHPFVRNIGENDPDAAHLVGALVEAVGRALRGEVPTRVSGALFIRPADVTGDPTIAGVARDIVSAEGIDVPRERLRAVLQDVHERLFHAWERCTTLGEVAGAVRGVFEPLAAHGSLEAYPPNLAAAERLLNVAHEFEDSLIAAERFEAAELFRLLRNRLETEVVSFSGSPLAGVQVLGMLETRALDFDTVIVLDVNESVLPRLRVHEPFIPREVMLALGLDRLEREEEIQRYQLTRLIAGAREAHLLYRVGGDAERSRFIERLVWERERAAGNIGVVEPEQWAFAFAPLPAPRAVPKSTAVLALLRSMCYSASAVDTYLSCPLQFYYQYVLRLRESEDPGEEPESRDIGTFLHRLLEEAYRPFIGTVPRIDADFRRLFRELLDRRFTEIVAPRMRTDAFMVREVVRYRMERFLDAEERRMREQPAVLAAVEHRCTGAIDVDGTTIQFQARLDRVDLIAESVPLILDYKSGANAQAPRLPVENVQTADRQALRTAIRSFQLPIYIHCYGVHDDIVPDAALYSLREPDRLSPMFKNLPLQARAMHLNDLRNALRVLLREILDPKVPFVPDAGASTNCEYCPYQMLCR